MTDKQLAEYAPFWGEDIKKYVLFSLDPVGSDLRRCMIVDRRNNGVELIENRELVLAYLAHEGENLRDFRTRFVQKPRVFGSGNAVLAL